MLTKENVKKFLFIAIMGYLAVNAVAQLYHLIAMIIAAIASPYYSFSALSAFVYIFACLAFLSLLVITASVTVEQMRSLKPQLERFWFVPACLYGVVLLLTVISIFSSTRYLSGFGAWVDWIFSSLFTFVTTALYLAAFMLLFPKALLDFDEGPVVDLSALGKSGAGARPRKPAGGSADAAEAEAPDDWRKAFGPQIEAEKQNTADQTLNGTYSDTGDSTDW